MRRRTTAAGSRPRVFRVQYWDSFLATWRPTQGRPACRMPDTKRWKSREGRREGEEELGGHRGSEGVKRAGSKSESGNKPGGMEAAVTPASPRSDDLRACVTASRDPFSRRRKVTLFRSATTATMLSYMTQSIRRNCAARRGNTQPLPKLPEPYVTISAPSNCGK